MQNTVKREQSDPVKNTSKSELKEKIQTLRELLPKSQTSTNSR